MQQLTRLSCRLISIGSRWVALGSVLFFSSLSTVTAQTAGETIVSTGYAHTCALIGGSVSCWGSNSHGQTDVPETLLNPKSVSAAELHSCAVDDNGVSCWGLNNWGQAEDQPGGNMLSVSAGTYHTCALGGNEVHCWGYNGQGQTTVPGTLSNPMAVSAGGYHSCALDDSGVQCWGFNDYGQLDTPALTNPTAVSAGELHTCAIDDTGVVCWGATGNSANNYGQSAVPATLSNPVAISAGPYHTCAVHDAGVACWGDSSNDKTTVPPSLESPTSVSAGAGHSCAVVENGITCWGNNLFGQSHSLVLPQVATYAPYRIEASSAIFHGLLVATGEPVATQHGFCWNTSGNPDINDACENIGGAVVGDIFATTTDLSPDTQYYVRAFATNDLGTVYGEEVTFTTLSVSYANTVEITIADSTAREDNQSGATFSFIRTGDLSAELAVYFSVGGTATPDEDYQALPGSITFPIGESEVTLDVAPIDDDEAEIVEEVTLTLIAGEFGIVDTGFASIALISDERPISGSAGESHTLFVDTQHILWAWGANNYGQIGDGSLELKSSPVSILAEVGSTAAGLHHSLALQSDGSLWAWGRNDRGQVGDGSTTNRLNPQLILSDVKSVWSAPSGSFAIKTDGTLWAWGRNDYGQLGDGTTTDRHEPVVIPLTGVVKVDGGSTHTLFLTEDGVMLGVGDNTFGQLGTGNTEPVDVPVEIADNVEDIAAVDDGSYALDENGTVSGAGNVSGGDPAEGIKIMTNLQRGAYKLYSGNTASALWAFYQAGNAQFGSGGPPPQWQNDLQPYIAVGSIAYALYGGSWFLVALAVIDYAADIPQFLLAGQGENAQGQLGNGSTDSQEGETHVVGFDPDGPPPTPLPVVSIAVAEPIGTETEQISASFSVLRQDEPTSEITVGYVLGGSATEGVDYLNPGFTVVLGAGNSATTHAITPIEDNISEAPEEITVRLAANTGYLVGLQKEVSLTIMDSPPRVKQLSAGVSHGLALSAGHLVWGWGDDSDGQLGNGDPLTLNSSPVPADLTDVHHISAGDYFSIASKLDGTVWTWGYNGAGQLGDGTETDRASPVQAPISNAIAVATTVTSSFALKSNGQVWGWGNNYNGELGTDVMVRSLTPLQLPIAGVSAISGGHKHMMALKTSGEVWTWGLNNRGQLGDSTETNRTIPVKVPISDVVAIAAGHYFSVALKRDGSVWAWGANDYGQLGDGTLTDRPSPVQVQGVTATAVAAGQQHVLAITEGSALVAWGHNAWGQLGDGTQDHRSTPVPVLLADRVFNIAASWNYSLAQTLDGILYRWGRDLYYGTATITSPLELFLPFSYQDHDGDGLENDVDNCVYSENYSQVDTDLDGLGDACDEDDDNDGLSDSDELNLYGTNPLLPDTDGDGYLDGEEVNAGSNPLAADDQPEHIQTPIILLLLPAICQLDAPPAWCPPR